MLAFLFCEDGCDATRLGILSKQFQERLLKHVFVFVSYFLKIGEA